MKAKSLVMFDYDGVIVDSLEFFTSDFIEACRENHFYDFNTQEDLMELFEDNVYKAMMRHGLSVETIDKILSSFEQKENKHLDDLRVFDGIADTMRRISEKNKIVVITSNLSNATMEVLKKNGINFIEDVIGADVEKSKIKKIQRTISRYPFLPAYYVGDTVGDIIEGRKAGVKTIGVTWGWHDVVRLKKANPDFIVYSQEELVELLTN